MKLAVAFAVILFTSLLTPAVFAHYPHTSDECSTTERLGSREECLLEQRESGKEVKFVDIFFSEGAKNVGGNAMDAIPAKLEVEPGDGTSILATVMANSGAFELTGLKGWLSLPTGFNAAGRPAGEPAFDTYDLGIAPGAAFVFEFPVEVTENTRVGMYKAILHIEYFKARDIGLNFRNFDVEFLLPGKSIIDAISDKPILIPSVVTTPSIKIINDGTAPASGVIVSVGPSGTAATLVETEAQAEQFNQIINVGKKVFNLGVIDPGSYIAIEPNLYVNPALRDTKQTMIVGIAYFDMYGQRREVGIPVNFLVSGTISEIIDFEIESDKAIIPTITPTNFTLTIKNTGTETARNVEVTGSAPQTATVALNNQVPQSAESPIMVIGGDGYRRIYKIEPGEKKEYTIILFASEQAVNTAYQLPISITYADLGGGLRQTQRFVSVYVQGTIQLRAYDLGITYIGNEPNISGYLLNEGTNLALFTTVELVENQDILKARGGPQYLGDLTANSPLPFNIPVQVAEGTEAANYPVTIKVSYKDDLRVPFEFEIEGAVPYAPPVIQKQENSSMFSNIGILVGIGAAGAVGYYLIRKKKIKLPLWAKEGEKKIDSDEDLDFLSDNKQ
jgi:hypothetical protein